MRNKILVMIKKAKYLLIFLLGIHSSIKAQFGFSHEIGAFVGGVALQSDFGVKNDFNTNVGNTGFAVGFVHYLDFSFDAKSRTYNQVDFFNSHFKLRTELSYNSTKLNHFGEFVNKESIYGEQLRAMKGHSKVFDIGMQLEYYPFGTRAFSVSDGSFAPYIGFGAHYSSFDNNVYSELGPLGTPLTTYPRYLPNGYSSKGGSTWSTVTTIGTRYKISPLSDLFVELRWQYYFSDWVDGLRKDPEIWKENKSNDWNVWFNFGYIYYISE